MRPRAKPEAACSTSLREGESDILLLLGPGLGVEARRRKELPIDREPGEAGVQQRAKASGEQSICKKVDASQEKKFH